MSTYQTIWNHAKRRVSADNITDAVAIEYLNFALDDYSSLVMRHDGRWKFDSPTNTDNPKGYAAAVSGQHQYNLATTFHQIDQVHFKVDGKWRVLEAIDGRDYQDQAPDSVHSTAGTPRYYDLDGQNIYLYPAPNFSDSGDGIANKSIRVRFSRPVELVIALSESIGISRIHRGYLVANICYQIASATNDPSLTVFRDEMMQKERDIIDDLTVRDESRARVIRPIISNVFKR